MLYPPTRVCQTFGCTRYRAEQNICTLTEPVSYKATLFTLRSGGLPVFAVSYYCRGSSFDGILQRPAYVRGSMSSPVLSQLSGA